MCLKKSRRVIFTLPFFIVINGTGSSYILTEVVQMRVVEMCNKYLCENVRRAVMSRNVERAEEIRLRLNKAVRIKYCDSEERLSYIVSKEDIENIYGRLTQYSPYAFKEEINSGYITVEGGYRIGISGTVIEETGEVRNIKNISSMNIRIAREIKGASNKLLKEIINQEENNIYNTLIVSPPGKGKTTILRDAIRQISNGIKEINFKGKTCGVVDERGELAACFRGIPQNDIGIRTDVIENVSKSQGIRMLIRSMSPQVIACDEIGSKEDAQAIKYAFTSGVKGIFTMHGGNLQDIKRNPDIDDLIKLGLIEKIFIL